ncbi:class I SAM-dependent DNA methyltransferase [Hyphococcus sp.]|jgi:hypothetical protein|uniref:class I SAM-dependent DNA methyltransferase n=1 Tax=Hyphococcus sp. TaxID=2038636 RepID=UPI003D114793
MDNEVERPAADAEKLKRLIADVGASGGAEISNFQPFIERLCEAMHLPKPDFAAEDRVGNDYCFERRVDHTFDDGRTTTRRIDLYRRGAFIMEAKQSAKRSKLDPQQLEMLGEEAGKQTKGHARRGSAKWDRVMQAAKNQAIDYARDLPVDHGYPPFILVIDVGNVIEVFADFSGQGKNYSHFPDRQSYRIALNDLLDTDIQDRLWRIWQDPHALDPAKISAAVTKDIAERLAKIAKRLEKKHAPEAVAEFLMRCLFTMFAEDVELIPGHGFEKLLERLKAKPQNFAPAVESLWRTMNEGGYDAGLDETLRRFNGALFRNARAIPLAPEDVHELHVAATKNWKDVEPAIFGTLLEQALDARERSKLGAHFTPRAYVERLVIPTIIEPLRNDWADVQARAAELEDAGDHAAALEALTDFHHTLCTTRVLDPACGTGNFLYVSFELMKKLEGEVLEALAAYSETQASLAMDTETVSPRQFYGLEINERAVPIAELVLWIGYLKWQIKTNGASAISEPILHAYGNIKHQDAILAYDKKELRRDETGKPVTIWDGRTKKLHPVTGEEVPDEDARIETYTYEKPRRADWPEAEFIVGNPPFIGGKDMRAELGDGYAEAAWKARKDVPGGADFVMHFWDEAASRLTAKPPKGKTNPLRRFGFITTNSITQTFSRRVVEKWMNAKQPLSLIFAVPDHPWLKSVDKAAVRIAMTVAVRGQREGVLAEVVKEEGLNTDTPKVELESHMGRIFSNLHVGINITTATPLLSNEDISFRGFTLSGQGFVVEPKDSLYHLKNRVVGYVTSGELTGRDQHRKVIDVFGLNEKQVRSDFPELYARLLERVKPERVTNNRQSYREFWWVFSEPRSELRAAINNIDRRIVTPRTAKHRFFLSLAADVATESEVITIATEVFFFIAILSSRAHVAWVLRSGGTLEDRPRYNNSVCFLNFPFPACVTDPDADNSHLDALGERLDAFRKERLDDWDWLTMTRLYNALERYREAMNGGEPLREEERNVHERAQIAILAELHDDIDRAVLDAYGWADLAPALVGKPGGTTPSPMKSPEQEEAEEELLSRLVALNKERAGEEARGQVRWLRPDYQIPKLGAKVPGAEEKEQIEADLSIDQGPDKPDWPADGLAQIRVVRDVLSAARGPVDADIVTRAFKQKYSKKRRERVEEVLANLAELGLARVMESEGGDSFVAAR